ncbi:DUF2889 domain-containing protein [Ramlibacter sp. MAHUQ-53]|uniref:DUF2889 domain-containing protein n=1 Tax=unclassified Ramlibacter TaxID=2617605 RepID=UPI003637C427
MPLPEPAKREHLHTRNVTFRGYAREDGLWDIEAELRDSKAYPIQMYERGELPPGEYVHHMAVRLTVDDAFQVRAVVATMDDTPLGECQQALPPVAGLVGARLGPGWRQAVDRVLGGTRGCTHMRELLVNAATAAYQTIPAGLQRRSGIQGPPGSESQTPPFHLGRCVSWDIDGGPVARYYPRWAGWAPLRRVDKPARPAEPAQPAA